jgi:glycosyltransferase 2 family protein
VNRVQSIWKVTWRAGVGALLLAWILQAIFMAEARRIAPAAGVVWEQLSRLGQWRLAWSHGPQALWHTLQLVDPGAMLLSFICMGATIVIGLLRWRMVLAVQGLNLSLARTTEISLVAHFFNSLLLGSTGGDLLKAYYAARETHHKKTEAVLTVLVDRLVGLFAMLLFACLMMLPNLALLARHPRLAALAWLVVLMMAGCGGLVVVSFWGGLSKTFPQVRRWLGRLPKGDLFERAIGACRQFGREPFFFVRMLAISMVLNVFCVLQILVLAWGLHLEISALALFAIVPIIVCISSLPITPSGLGVRENLYVLMLAVPEIGVDSTRALALSLLAYAGFLLWSIIGGIVYLGRRDRDNLAEIAANDPVTEEVGGH